MNKIFIILILSLVGGIIGWLTNILAIKLMFRPINPMKIPILNIEILGLIPKRKNEIAENIGEVVATELLSIDDLINESFSEEDKENLILTAKEKIKSVINEKITLIPMPFRMMATPYIDKIVDNEVGPMIENMSEDLLLKIKDKVNIQKIVEEKIKALDLIELEAIIIKVAKKELKHIEILGFVLGALIGLIQAVVLNLF
ncbi:DUF445 family protein [uncultured Clostridium sp.]|uniref:DUF445 domain-containing protein n=1 Tax=uncultured Clostridium sp. TaxID=59620 RepID=UPI0025F6AB78|nr:DUF445 family protein [uncultured Clostridium sp.]